MRTVLHYVPRWLPSSEQFVDQLLRRSSYRAAVAVRWGVVDPGAFPQRPLIRLDLPLARVPRRVRGHAIALGLLASLRTQRASLLHVHFGYELEGVVAAARRAEVPLVVSLHGNDVTSTESRDSPALRHALAAAAAVTVPSRFLAEYARAAGASQSRIKILPSGVDRVFFSPHPLPQSSTCVVFVGRFVEKKGLDVLAAAWPLVVAKVPAAELLLLGRGPLDAAALLPAAQRWLPEPHRRAEQVRDALRSAAVVVTPSRTAANGDSESLLLVNLEAQSSGRPVVTTRHGGIPEAVCPESALLVPEGDPAALASALVRVLQDRGLAESMAAAGVQFAAEYDADMCAARVDQLYDELLP